MNNKIKELAENIYNEGVAKAQKEAEEILTQARTKAEQALASAKAEAENIISKATQEAEQISLSVKAELLAVSEQTIEITRQKITNLITAGTAVSMAEKLTTDEVFVKEMLLEITRNWLDRNGQSSSIEAHISPEMLARIEPAFQLEANRILSGKVNFKPISGINKGFAVANEAEGFRVSFTDEDFQHFFSSLMKPALRRFLFNNNNEQQ